ncbi:MAG: type II toxin-antitoxin system HicB family antitoxin [Planctomycetes bacterium]|nr:type II toxin-antitoxin system HicB family antitoxin [Planctomycetota bacterium]
MLTIYAFEWYNKNRDTECPVLPGCVTQGNTREEATENIKNAISEYLAAVKKEG